MSREKNKHLKNGQIIIDSNKMLDNGKTIKETMALRRENILSGEIKLNSSFEEVFGDLSNYSFNGSLNLDFLNIDSLKGCPKFVHGSYFAISSNEKYRDFEGFPELTSENCHIYIAENHVSRFSVDYQLYERVKLVLIKDTIGNMFSDIDLVVSFSGLRKKEGSFEKIRVDSDKNSGLDYHSLEKIFAIYRNLNFDEEKLRKFAELVK